MDHFVRGKWSKLSDGNTTWKALEYDSILQQLVEDLWKFELGIVTYCIHFNPSLTK